MNRKRRGVSASKQGIELLKTAKAKGKEGKPLTYARIAELADINDKTVKRFFNGKGVDPYYADKIIETLSLANEQILSLEESLVEESIERIESRSVTLEEQKDGSERPSKLIAELERNLKTLKERTANSHQAMDWLKVNKNALAKDATNATLRANENQATHSEDTNTNHSLKFEQLSKDIRKYLQLLYSSLDEGTSDVIVQAINEILVPLNLENRFYIAALTFIKEERVAKELSPEVAKELTILLDELISMIIRRC